LFLGPDNGLLTLAAPRRERLVVRELANADLFWHPVSNTFHGRDVFASVAGHLVAGVPLEDVGPEVREICELEWPRPEMRFGALHGRVLYVDRFGNLITNFDAASLSAFATEQLWFRIRGAWIQGLVPTYASLSEGALGALFGSWGLMEIAVRNGSAARVLEAGVGDEVVATTARTETPGG
jgi:S-adenosylmethionine hydrolase